MDSEVTSQAGYGSGNPLIIFITSLCAAIVVAGGFGIIILAFIVAGADLFELGQTFVFIGGAVTGLLTLWLFAWCFARSYHVERRLQAGLEVDEPELSIMANFRDLGPASSKP
jgi:hypothetical protein